MLSIDSKSKTEQDTSRGRSQKQTAASNDVHLACLGLFLSACKALLDLTCQLPN